MLMKKIVQLRRVTIRRTIPTRCVAAELPGESLLSDPEGEVGDTVESEQFRIDAALHCPDQPLRLTRVERELDDRAGDVPGDVLASDQIVPPVMIERVGLDQGA